MYNNNLRQLKVILYRLKRSFGMPVVFTIPIVNTYDVTTGATTREFTSLKVRRAIVLPVKTIRDFAYDLTYIASNKNFVYGGYYDSSARNVIIQNSDLKKNVPGMNWLCTFQNRKYTVKALTETEDNAGYILACSALDKVTA